MVLHIIIIEPLKNHNIKCHNVLEQHNNKHNILNGNNIEQLKEKNSTTMHLRENLVGSYLIKLSSIKESYRNRKKNKNKWMVG